MAGTIIVHRDLQSFPNRSLETVREGGMGENYFQIQNTEKFENQKGD
jgi:hypothetical protein